MNLAYQAILVGLLALPFSGCPEKGGFECRGGEPFLDGEDFSCSVCYRSQGCTLDGSTWTCPPTADLSCSFDNRIGSACCGDDCITCGDADISVAPDDGGGNGFVPRAGTVDLLIVMDNSSGMGEAQAFFAAQVDGLLSELLSPPGDAPPVTDLHVGVVSTDLGAFGYVVSQYCNVGQQGRLQSAGVPEGCAEAYSAADCSAEPCPWLSHSTETPHGGASLSQDVGCIASLGIEGCGFEQPLEASLRALTTASGPGGPNEGFLRPDSLLVILYVSDEDDCSTANPELFNPARDDYGPLGVRCVVQSQELLSVDHFFSSLRALRSSLDHGVLVGVIAGGPSNDGWTVAEVEAMQKLDPADPTKLAPSCVTDHGVAFPPVRLTQLASMFGEDAVLGSICGDDYSEPFQALAERIQARLP